MADVRRATARSVFVSFAFALIGLAVAVYLTIEHYDSSVTLACPESLLGLVFFMVMAMLCSPPAWRVRRLDGIRVVGAVLGVVSVVFLVWVELFRVNAICLWCTVIHICSVGLLVAILWRVSALPPRGPDQAG